jgi:lactate dehydrogenase-like 2-hydroxyacid dehydrogenase
MRGTKVAVTDYTFDSLDIEKSILEDQGLQLTSQKSGKDPQQLIALVRDADYVITQFAPMDAGVIAAMQKCRVIVRYGIGVDNVDLRAAAAKGIPVCNVPDFGESTHCLSTPASSKKERSKQVKNHSKMICRRRSSRDFAKCPNRLGQS